MGQEYPLQKEMAPHSSILVWRISGTEEPGKLPSMRSQRVSVTEHNIPLCISIIQWNCIFPFLCRWTFKLLPCLGYVENIFFDPSPRIMEIKTKINKWDLFKLNHFCPAKEVVSKMKIQHTDWEKIFANDVTNKGLVSKTYKQPMMLNSIKINNPINRWKEDLHRHFSKEDKQKVKRHMERSLTSLIIRKIKIKSSMRYLTPIKITIIKKSINNKC